MSLHPDTHPKVQYQNLELTPEERLPPYVIDYIQKADTSFLATSYVAPLEIRDDYPSHVGTNHRGGRPGFVRVRPSDGRTVVLPNYNGEHPKFHSHLLLMNHWCTLRQSIVELLGEYLRHPVGWPSISVLP